MYYDGGLKCRKIYFTRCNYVKLLSSHRFHSNLIIIVFYDSFAVDYSNVLGLAAINLTKWGVVYSRDYEEEQCTLNRFVIILLRIRGN